MYSKLRNVQIMVALLKKAGVRHMVLSAGARNIPIVHSVENDPYFTCYSVVDERSAAFFAMGIAQELKEPVAISCTSSTACCNYLSAVTEAYYQKIPLIVITADRDPFYMGQMETLMINQQDMYKDVVRKSVQLPYVTTEREAWYCQRLINEALLELDHHGHGPVHINIPIMGEEKDFSVDHLPDVTLIKRHIVPELSEKKELWDKKVKELENANRVLVICGQDVFQSNTFSHNLEVFFSKFNCVISVEHMSNVNCEGALHTFLATETNTQNALGNLLPDIVITFGGNYAENFKGPLRRKYGKFKHWRVNEAGDVVDTFKSLTDIFECTADYFLSYFNEHVSAQAKNNKEYYGIWKKHIEQIVFPEPEFSNVYIIREFLKIIPENSILNLSILNSIRISQYYSIPESVKCYANLGAYGIDGCLSTFIGQSYVTDKCSFMIIGDLSFFYDMNAIWIRHIKSNVRILVINNGGGAEFHYNTGLKVDPTIDRHTSAKHSQSVQAWIEVNGFRYLKAHNKEELKNVLPEFVAESSDAPIVLEVYSNMETDASAVLDLISENRSLSSSQKAKSIAKNLLGDKVYGKLKDTFR